jgi:excisionase family DNA binding protein
MISDDLDYDDLMTPGEVARAFRVDPRTVVKWAHAGKLHAILTPGGIRRYGAAEVNALLAGSVQPRETP